MAQAPTAAAPAAAAAASYASPSIYVGNLDPRVTEAMLYEHFRAVGPVVSVRVCIDSTTQKSLGYGYVNFQGAPDSERAIDLLNGSKLSDRAITVARVLRDPTLRKSGVTNIVVKNLPESADAKALKELFGKFGSIISIKIATDDTGKPRGLAYIMFDKEQAAQQAVTEANGVRLAEGEGSEPLAVERYRSPAVMQQEALQSFTNLYIKNLAPTVTDAQLEEAFKVYGEITSAKVRQDDTGRTVGFGWVAFADHTKAVLASEATDGKEHPLAAEGTVLAVRRFMSKKERMRNRELRHRERIASYSKFPNLYVKNFDDTVTEERMKAVFDRFGETHSVKIAVDPVTKVSRGFGFVSYQDAGAAQKAVNELSGSRDLGSRPLYVTFAQRRDIRRQQQEELFRKRTSRAMQGFPGAGMMQPPMMFPGAGMFPPGMMGPQMGGYRMPMQPMMPRPMMQQPMMPMGPQGAMMGQIPGMFPPGMQMPMRAPMARPVPVPARVPVAAPPAPAHPSGLDPQYLASMSAEQQKNVLGERLYSYIIKIDQPQAAKITGMLLEIDNFEILNLLDSPDQLNAKIKEAQDVLARHTTM